MYGSIYSKKLKLAVAAVLAVSVSTFAAEWTRTGTTTNLTNSGDKVGVGTTLPSDKMDIRIPSTAVKEGLTISSPNTTGNQSQPAVVFKRYSGATLTTVSKIYSNNGDILFTTGTGTSPSDRMIIDNAGRVGIGTTLPGTNYKLDISGVFHIANGNQALFSNSGTAGAPSISFDNDQNTGIINPSNADNLGFVTNGSERMRIDQVGNIGIGMNPETGYKLDVNGKVRVANGSQLNVSATSTATAPAITFNNNYNTGIFSPGNNTVAITTGSQERLRVDPNGRVSIGATTAPTNGLLLVNGGASIGYGTSESIPLNGLIVNGDVRIGPEAGTYGKLNVNSPVGIAIHALSSASEQYAIYAEGLSNDGGAIRAYHRGARGVGIYAESEGGDAGKFVGNVTVSGTLQADAVKIKNWTIEAPDYVFEKDYKLPSLKEVEKKIKAEKHLSDVPSAVEMKKNGVDLSKMNMTLLKKVEELTLYMIDQNNKIESQNKKIESLEKRITR